MQLCILLLWVCTGMTQYSAGVPFQNPKVEYSLRVLKMRFGKASINMFIDSCRVVSRFLNLAVFQTHADTHRHTRSLAHTHPAAGQSVPETKAVSDAERRAKNPWKIQWACRRACHATKKLLFFSSTFVLNIYSDDKIS